MKADTPEAEAWAAVPMKWVGPVLLTGALDAEVRIPLATYETPLFPSVARGARVTREAGGIRVTVRSEFMTRSVLFEAPSADRACAVAREVEARLPEAAEAAQTGSRFARFHGLRAEVVGPLLFLRLEMETADAAGHNMTTVAAQHLMDWMHRVWTDLKAVSVSGNFCADKKVSAVNGLLGRGRSIIAETVISESICRRRLRATPAAIADLCWKKNWVGSAAAGSLRSANAHVANMLLAFYLATGQDGANIVEGSQSFTLATVEADGALRISVTLPHLICGTVGNGKNLAFVEQNLQAMGCREPRAPGENARRLAAIASAAVLCGELSLLAALANPGELVRTHVAIERGRART
ncbi:MAG: hydroxymethylglutaryl-CoA reductase [Kiritimatiellae bacterium]|nr:hydroxymethylglutaryl-CoA reductase [Kiritimatiellia bacterium]